MSRGRSTHDHEIIKNRDFDREVFFRLETELFHINEKRLSDVRAVLAERANTDGVE